jgi:hypothetical protein
VLVRSAHWSALLVNSDQLINVEALHYTRKPRQDPDCRAFHRALPLAPLLPDALTVTSHRQASAAMLYLPVHGLLGHTAMLQPAAGASTLSADEWRVPGALDDYAEAHSDILGNGFAVNRYRC